MEYNAQTGFLEIQSLLSGNGIKRLRSCMPDLIQQFELSEDEYNLWTSFTLIMDDLWSLGKEKDQGKMKVTIERIKMTSSSMFRKLIKNPVFFNQITPYLHLLSSHVPTLLLDHPNLVLFSQQAAEHWIGKVQRLFHHQTNHQLSSSSTSTSPQALKRIMTVSTVIRRQVVSAPINIKRRQQKKN